jgi:hypothetical protein
LPAAKLRSVHVTGIAKKEKERRPMPTQCEVLVYLKFPLDIDMEEAAQRVFAALGGTPEYQRDEETGEAFYRVRALGLEAALFANEGALRDEDFAAFPYGLSVVSLFECPELELAPVESPLADYYARLLAFALDIETATSFYLGSQNGSDLYEIRGFRRNPQFLPNSGPTVPRVYMTERRTVEYEAMAANEYLEGEVTEEAFEENE